MLEQSKKNAELWRYLITGYYFAGKDREHKRFEEIVFAENNHVAMEQVVGKYAWKESLDCNSFELDVIHYDCY